MENFKRNFFFAVVLIIFSSLTQAINIPVHDCQCSSSGGAEAEGAIYAIMQSKGTKLGGTIRVLHSDGTIHTWKRVFGSIPEDQGEVQDEDLGENPCASDGGDCPSPILIDLGQDGMNLAPAGVGAEFDIRSEGYKTWYQWVSFDSNDAFLTLDINQNGLIDDGSELFGEGTSLLLEGGQKAKNGYIALAQYDKLALGGNNDGAITADDFIWSELSLWIDKNADGFTDNGEQMSLSESGLTYLGLNARESNQHDQAGNLFALWSWAKNENKEGNKKYRMIDVFFKRL